MFQLSSLFQNTDSPSRWFLLCLPSSFLFSTSHRYFCCFPTVHCTISPRSYPPYSTFFLFLLIFFVKAQPEFSVNSLSWLQDVWIFCFSCCIFPFLTARLTEGGITCICSLRCRSIFCFTHLSPYPSHILISCWDKYWIDLILSLHVSMPCLNVHRKRIKLPVQEDTSKPPLCPGDSQSTEPEPVP